MKKYTVTVNVTLLVNQTNANKLIRRIIETRVLQQSETQREVKNIVV